MNLHFNRSGFTPEQNKAFQEVVALFPMRPEQIWENLPTVEVLCTTGNKFIINGSISARSLPRRNVWLWNQSRARTETSNADNSIRVLFYKLNTRKSRYTPIDTLPPRYKLWIFEIELGQMIMYLLPKSKYSIIWCERGTDIAGPLPDDEDLENSLANLGVEDFQFLSPFVSGSVAASLGWNKTS